MSEKEVSKKNEPDIKKMNDDEFHDWAASHIMQSLIKGSFKSGVMWALQCHSVWSDAERTRLEKQVKAFQAKKRKKNSKKKSKKR